MEDVMAMKKKNLHNLIQLPANWICILYPMEIGTICHGGRYIRKAQQEILSAKIT